jgi:hypothetical protein
MAGVTRLPGSLVVRKMLAMKHLRRWLAPLSIAFLCVSAAPAAPAPSITDQPATLKVEVAPATVASGGQARVTLTLQAADGVKINRYPKVRFSVDEQPGLVSGAETTVGSDSPPPVEQTEGNYFESVDPLTLKLAVDDRASTGSHEIEGQLVYYYCVTKSGFCAPKKTPVKIALNVR